jgi:hypothetical protein
MPTTPETIELNLLHVLMRHLDDFSLAEKDIITKWTFLVDTRARLSSSEFVDELRRLGVR